MTLKPNKPASKDPGDQSIALKINHKGLPLALINATVAVSLGTLFLAWSGSEMAGGLGLIFPTADLYPLERAATIPFTFCFVYGLWMSHCNGGKIWIAVLSILSLFSLLFYEWYRAHIDFNHLDPDLFVSVFSGCTGAFIGYKAFKLLRRRCTIRTSLWVTQAYLLAFPLVLFLLHVAKLPHNLLTYLLVGLGFGIASGLTGGGPLIRGGIFNDPYRDPTSVDRRTIGHVPVYETRLLDSYRMYRSRDNSNFVQYNLFIYRHAGIASGEARLASAERYSLIAFRKKPYSKSKGANFTWK